MLSRNDIKTRGTAVLKKLELLVRSVSVFSVEHQSAQVPLQQCFDAVNALLRETRHLTVGFSEGRAMVNNIFFVERTLAQLEQEFDRRHIGAISFEAGLTMARFRKAVSVISVPAKTIEAAGGIRKYLDSNKMEGVRIFTADSVEGGTSGGGGGGMGLSLGGVDPAMASSLGGLDLMLGAASMDAPTQFQPEADSILRLVPRTVEEVIGHPDSDMDKCYSGLSRILGEMQTKFVDTYFPAERRQELRQATSDQVAREYIEDETARWAAKRLATTPEPQLPAAEDSVLDVIMRSLAITRVTERLSAKLADYLKEYAVPRSTYDRIRDELHWVALPVDEKLARLMELKRFDRITFRRLLLLLHDLLALSRHADATALANHYFDFLEGEEEVQPEEMSRAPELIRVAAGTDGDFIARTMDRLVQALFRPQHNALVHFQIGNALSVLSKTLAIKEDFAGITVLGTALEKCFAQDAAAHRECCGMALQNLLAPNSEDRLIETFLQRRDDSSYARTVGTVLRLAGGKAIDKLFLHLEEEKNASNRLAVLRLLGQTGPAAIAAARQRLADNRWYVVRNACQILGMLKDPEMVERLAPLLAHEDERVQQVTVSALIKNRVPGRERPLAENLNRFRGNTLDEALHELLFVKSPDTVPALESFLFQETAAKLPFDKAVQALAVIPGDPALAALGRVLAHTAFSIHVRRIALDALRRSTSPSARNALAQFASAASDDPLAAEAKKATATT